MKASVFEIIDRQKERPFAVATFTDFTLGQWSEIEADVILETPHITLYCLDFENGRAVFVETPPDLDLSLAPFYFNAQFDHARRLLTLPFDALIELVKSRPVDDTRLVFIHSVGRSGSTLASQIFAAVPGVIGFSEPDAFMNLLRARLTDLDPGTVRTRLLPLVDAVVRVLCKDTAETAWVLKERSYVIELADWLFELYPQARHLFLYRDAASYLQSAQRTIMDNRNSTPEEIRAKELKRRTEMGPIIPLIKAYDPAKHLDSAGILTLMWLSVMERYITLNQQGQTMLAIRYDSWRTHPRETAVAMLDYARCQPSDLTAVTAALARDSQAGTHYAQSKVRNKRDPLPLSDLETMTHHLSQHPIIKTPNYQAPNTLT